MATIIFLRIPAPILIFFNASFTSEHVMLEILIRQRSVKYVILFDFIPNR